MPSPQWNGSPSSYQPNPIDDRLVTGPHRAAYFEVATALDAIESLHTREDWTNVAGEPAPLMLALDKATRKALRVAESNLRRAAFLIVLHSDG